MPMPGRGLTPEQKAFIHENYRGTPFPDLVRLVQDRFGESVLLTQIRAYVHNNRLWNGLNTQFKPGCEPFNKGKKKTWAGGEATQFQKGHKPHNYKPVGTERVNGDDYVDIKIADPNMWKGKHILVWESHNGPVPKGHAVIFGDGDRRNFDPNNLILVSRKQLAVMNKHGLIQGNADLTRTGVILADIYRKIGEKRRSKTNGG